MGETTPEHPTQSAPPSFSSTLPSPYTLIGETLSGYRIKELLGAGGMGLVYKAFDEKLQRLVAIKLLPHNRKDSEHLEQLREEAKTVAQLQHPHIVSVHVLGEDKGQIFFVMELCEGKTLDQRLLERKNSPIKSRKIFPVEQSLKIIREVGAALSYAHKKGIVHRDVKPGNVILLEGGFCKLMDFGLACLTNKASADSSMIAGTPAYMSPEQTLGQTLDGRSDQFSLGVIFYELLTGRPPFKADSARALFQDIHNTVPPPPSLSNPDANADVDAVVFVMMEKNREDRYASMEACLADIEKLVQNKNTDAFEKVSGYHKAPGTRKGSAKPYKLKRKSAKNAGGAWKRLRTTALILFLALLLGGGNEVWKYFRKATAAAFRPQPSPGSRDLQMAKNYLGIGRPDLARPILESLAGQEPESKGTPETQEAKALLAELARK